MSSIKDLLNEENDAERMLKDSEREAEAIIRDARAKAKEMMRIAQTDDAAIKELTERSRERIVEMKTKVFEECQVRVAETERLYRKNLDAAIKLIVEKVLGVAVERRSA